MTLAKAIHSINNEYGLDCTYTKVPIPKGKVRIAWDASITGNYVERVHSNSFEIIDLLYRKTGFIPRAINWQLFTADIYNQRSIVLDYDYITYETSYSDDGWKKTFEDWKKEHGDNYLNHFLEYEDFNWIING